MGLLAEPVEERSGSSESCAIESEKAEGGIVGANSSLYSGRRLIAPKRVMVAAPRNDTTRSTGWGGDYPIR